MAVHKNIFGKKYQRLCPLDFNLSLSKITYESNEGCRVTLKFIDIHASKMFLMFKFKN